MVSAAVVVVCLCLCVSWLALNSVVIAQNTIAECGSNLVSCAPFVQGMAAAPVQPCCASLNQLYSQKPSCLCLLLHDTNLASSFPINTTLALQLPLLCNLQIHNFTCGGGGTSLSPPTAVSFGEKPNSSAAAAASPVAPRPSFRGFGVQHNAEARLKAKGQLLMLLLAAIFTVLTELAGL